MTATFKIFQVGEKLFKHVINTQYDSVELRDENEAVLLNYGTDARVTNHAGRVGTFYAEYIEGQPRWVYYEMPLETRTVFGPDLSSAEVEVSKHYIGRLDLTTEPGQVGASLFVP
jgi:hypothetical protein